MNQKLVGLVLFLVCPFAHGQWKIQIAVSGGAGGKQSTTQVWTNGCEARIADTGAVAAESDMYMIIRDCGRTTIAVSPSQHSAAKMPPMQSNPAPDIETAAAFMQGTPKVVIEKIEEKPGETILGRHTTYFHFRVTYAPDPNVTVNTSKGPIGGQGLLLVSDEEFWIDPTIIAPAVDELLGKKATGPGEQNANDAFSKMNGLPLKHRRTVVIERAGIPQGTPAFTQEVVSLDQTLIADQAFGWPKDYKYVDLSAPAQ